MERDFEPIRRLLFVFLPEPFPIPLLELAVKPLPEEKPLKNHVPEDDAVLEWKGWWADQISQEQARLRRGDEQSEARPLRSNSPSVTYYPLRGAHPIIDRLLARAPSLVTLALLAYTTTTNLLTYCPLTHP